MAKVKPVEFLHRVIDPEPAGTFNDVTLLFDVNGNGYNDIVIGGFKGQDNLVWYEWPTWRRHVIGGASLEAGGAAFDLTGNGRLDVVAGEMHDNHLYWWENPPNPTQRWTRRVIEDQIRGNYHDQIFADVDGDGEPELVILSKMDDVGVYYDLPDDPTVEPWPADRRHVIYEGLKLEGLAVADIDGDGVNEIIVAGGYFKPPARKAKPWRRIGVAEHLESPRVAVADLTGNGALDLVFSEAESTPAQLVWFEGPEFKRSHVLRTDLFHAHSLAIADFNGNGHLDIFAAEMSLGRHPGVPRLLIYLNDGCGNFTETVIECPQGTHEAKVADIGNTGRPSIVGKPYTPHNQIDLWENVTE